LSGGPAAAPDRAALVKGGLLLAFSGYFFYLPASHTLRNYTNPEFSWLVILTAWLFLALGLAGVYQWAASHGSAIVSDHAHPAIARSVLALVAVPLLLGILVPASPLGATARASNWGGATVAGAGSSGTPPAGPGSAPAADGTGWTLVDWQRAFQYKVYPDSYFTDKHADVIGFVSGGANLPADGLVIGRYVMRHCAADIYGVGLLVRSPGTPSLARGTWVRVQGTLRVAPVNGTLVLQLQATHVDATIGQPAETYIYPQDFARFP